MMDSEDSVTKRGRGRGRSARGRAGGRSRGRGRGRVGKKGIQIIHSDEEDTCDQLGPVDERMEVDENQIPPPIDMEADISQLEAPTFSTIDRGPPEPMLRLRWDHHVNLMGDKVLNPMIHCCDTCSKPILIYGRMIPCKHVFCLACAKKEDKVCPRCSDKVTRVEQTGLGTVFMCTHGGTRYGNSGCRRTYLSQRDLQAHINHRHLRGVTTQLLPGGDSSIVVPVITAPKVEVEKELRAPVIGDPRANLLPHSHQHHRRVSGGDTRPPPHNEGYGNSSRSMSTNPSAYSQVAPIPVMTSRTNLITVPIQDNSDHRTQMRINNEPAQPVPVYHQTAPHYPAPSPVQPNFPATTSYPPPYTPAVSQPQYSQSSQYYPPTTHSMNYRATQLPAGYQPQQPPPIPQPRTQYDPNQSYNNQWSHPPPQTHNPPPNVAPPPYYR